ncbi:ABC transporter permease [Virgibacillus senegalensis]|uniref:ABC transporter permease n=1 Tax=Virgibacillus senegalensis TaxID=1499679 RepID=UPI00069DAA27|nr:ABC transporter permease [Virgibacillus senegalensis]
MLHLTRIVFFIKQHHKQLQKKWKSLPLLLLFPIILIALFFYIVSSILLPDEDETIQVGLVDLDKSEETTMLVDVIDNSSLLGSYIHITHFTGPEAERAVKDGTISAYIAFPEQFTNDLYTGKSVEIPIVGNADRPVESYVIKELVESMTRYIASAQASILTINEYAKQLPISDKKRQEILLDQFNEFMIYTLSAKGKIFNEREVTNLTTSNPAHYYALAGWFVLTTIWFFGIFTLLGDDEGTSMWNRMRLYNVTFLQRMISRLAVTFGYGMLLAMSGFILYIKLTKTEFYLIDFGRITLLVTIYSLLFLTGMAISDLLFRSKKMTLFIQGIFTGLVLFISGAFIPSLYFPEKVQTVLPYLFSAQAFDQLTKVAMEGRMFAEYGILILLGLVHFAVLVVLSIWKERVQEWQQ